MRTAIRWALLSAILALALTAGPAAAQTTHKYLYSFDVSGPAPQVGGVDAQGNLYVFNDGNNTVTKYDPVTGDPVDFSALGTNVLDGAGGFNCPAVPADCDRVPANRFEDTYGGGNGAIRMAVDPRSTGPAAGYIYVASNLANPRVEVFAPSGKFVGALPLDKPFPDRGGQLAGVSVNADGHVFAAACCYAALSQFAPVDGNPANMNFVGQLRGGGGAWNNGFAGVNYTYGWSGYGPVRLHKFPSDQYLQPSGDAMPMFIPPLGMPFADGGAFPEGNDQFSQVSIDPANEDAYISGPGPAIEQWSEDNVQIGPTFRCCQDRFAFVGKIGFDHSGGPNDGYLYTADALNGHNSIAVLSGLVTIPDVEYGPPAIGHAGAGVEADVSLDGGPPVTSCKVEYGLSTDSNGNQLYERPPLPCDQATPFATDTTVTAELAELTTETDYHYRVVVANENGVTRGADQVVRPAAVLGVATGAATDVDRTTATLNGSLDPDGMPTIYRFEYGLDTTYDSQTDEVTIPSGSGQVDVTPLEVTQLQPGRTYHYRLVAENGLGTSYGADATFQAARGPTISGVQATDVTETTAEVHARINPGGYDTSYRFEYGTTPAYGVSVPAEGEIEIGDGTAEQEVSAHLSGLQVGTTYHFRVVATNQWGTTVGDNTTFSFFPPSCPNAHVRQQTRTNYLPDCRAYELVSPGSAGSVQLFPSGMTEVLGEGFGVGSVRAYSVTAQNSGLATSPSRFAFFGGIGSITGLDAPNSLIDMYVSTRTNTGWVTTYPGLKGTEAAVAARPQCNLEMSRCLSHRGPSFFGSSTEAEIAPHLFDVSGRRLGQWPTNLGVMPPGSGYFGGADKASADFSHYVFSSPEVPFTGDALLQAPGSAYDNEVGESTITKASILPDGADIPQGSGPPDEFVELPSISRDGSHILMSTVAPGGATNLYMRVDGAISYEVSKGFPVEFAAMTSDGSEVVFSSVEPVTSDDGDESSDVFVWSEATDAVARISKGNGQGDEDDCNASWIDGCGSVTISPERGTTPFGEAGIDDYIASESADAYFYSPEQLDPLNPGVRNQRNLYLYRAGSVQYVTTLDPGTQVDRAQVSPDGDHAGFVTSSRLTGYDTAGYRQMYSYDATTGAIQCVSCNPSGAAPTGPVEASVGGRFMADDGRTFFTTPDALVAQDTNKLMDVYEFVDGRPQLITAGTGERDRYGGAFPAGVPFYPPQYTGLEAVSGDGVDVYFSTFDELVPEDINGQFVKFYNARTGGGFPHNPGLAPCAAADECHGGDSAAPTPMRVGSDAPYAASGNPAEPITKKRAARKKRKNKRQQRRAKAQHKRQGGRNG